MADRVKVTPYHHWIRKIDDDKYCVGITNDVQLKLKEIQLVELPSRGEYFEQGEICGFIESMKHIIDLLMPMSGVIVHKNLDLLEQPKIINESPHDLGWLFVIENKDRDQWGKLDELDKDIR